ncbi:uncharacterized protein LTR77_005970 [Saxophila tyrrhenica]|uniref:F-box domain-containing protein n=1 Tax=Saxophila tyrrhenica TaxID=1690608 RepID=A0AAV9P6K7_9PEZI|nr:hypothetical protein LTR77_005970 [Saxophila tyrrhenica]
MAHTGADTSDPDGLQSATKMPLTTSSSAAMPYSPVTTTSTLGGQQSSPGLLKAISQDFSMPPSTTLAVISARSSTTSSYPPEDASATEGFTPQTFEKCLQVLETVELLEMILFALPTKVLLFAQKVSTQWKDVMDNSLKLQQALFFTSISDDLLDVSEGEKRYAQVVNNPLLDGLQRVPLEFEPGDTFLGGASGAAMLHRSWLHKDASWKRMTPTQPAISHHMWLILGLSPVRVTKELMGKDPDQAVKNWAAKYAYSPFWDDWQEINQADEKMFLGDVIEAIDVKLGLLPTKLACASTICDMTGELPTLESNDELEEMIEHAKSCEHSDFWSNCSHRQTKIEKEEQKRRLEYKFLLAKSDTEEDD